RIRLQPDLVHALPPRGPSRGLSFLGAYASRGSVVGTRRIVQRAAPEGGEAGAEDRSGVDQVGVGNDMVGKRGLRFGDEVTDQAIDEPRGYSTGRPFRRLA